MSRKRNTLNFRLRKIDADLQAAIQGIDDNVISDLCRDGLRMVLGLKTTRRIEVTEKPLVPFDSITIKTTRGVWINPSKR